MELSTLKEEERTRWYSQIEKQTLLLNNTHLSKKNEYSTDNRKTDYEDAQITIISRIHYYFFYIYFFLWFLFSLFLFFLYSPPISYKISLPIILIGALYPFLIDKIETKIIDTWKYMIQFM